jgi:hypothetical protein
MRSQLVIAGLFTLGIGGVLYITLGFYVSYFLAIGGVVMVVVSFFLEESEGPVRPPEGSVYCVFCSTLVNKSAERCDHCGGLQPWARAKMPGNV